MARTTLQINKRQEIIGIEDENGEPLYEWVVDTDDDSIQRMLNRVQNAFLRAPDLEEKARNAKTEEEAREANEATVKLQRRGISAIIGEQGYNDILEYIGDGEPVDPYDHIITIGDVFGTLCVWLYERCTSKQLREAGLYMQAEQRRTGGNWAPNNRNTRRKSGKGKKKGRR